METQANMVNNLVNAEKFKEALKAIERIKNKIKKMRNAGLESAMREFSIENIAFKILRRNDTLQMLNTLRDTAYDRLMKVKEE